MNNNHNVKDLDLLYLDAKELVNVIVLEKFDGNILKNIDSIISNLGEFWHGQDAVIQINKIIDIKNLLIDNREIVGNVGVYISMLAKSYRDAQNFNEAILPSFSLLSYQEMVKSEKIKNNSSEIYMNNNISNTVTALTNLIKSLEEINNSVVKIKNSIFDNWIQEDENRNYALKIFDKFSDNSIDIIKKLDESIKYINAAISSYNSSSNKVSNMPSLESMFSSNDNTLKNNYTPEEREILNSIEENLQYNRKLNDSFNNALVREVKKDLVSKGIM